MFAANSFTIRRATQADQPALRRLAELDSRRPLTGMTLIGEIDGYAAAALSMTDGRVVADPFQPTARLTPLLRARADALRAFSRAPAQAPRRRLGAGVRVTRATPAAARA
jgi:hypothetical protein